MTSLRHRRAQLFRFLTWSAAIFGLLLIVAIFGYLIQQGMAHLDGAFFENYASRIPAKAGIKAALAGTLYVMALTMFIAVPIGVGTAIFFEEYLRPSKLKGLLELNISNLAGVPSIIFGVLGLSFFVRFLGWERSIISGSLTLAILLLPVIVIATRSALTEVPRTIKESAYALGATKEQMIWYHLAPNALPGICSGIIIALGRAIGESAPLIMVGALSFVAYTPESVWDSFTVLPVQIFNWASRPQPEFQAVAASAILVLLALVIIFTALTTLIRQKFAKKKANY
ncbi:MAG TPA: phosphate ABC transporter permease PstA [Bdellovibrionota bacterium]|jgi:phosphate transport system permease protein|nr:phosphate ABC transporter permease PstA [Bdellovibrionota bacterium]